MRVMRCMMAERTCLGSMVRDKGRLACKGRGDYETVNWPAIKALEGTTVKCDNSTASLDTLQDKVSLRCSGVERKQPNPRSLSTIDSNVSRWLFGKAIQLRWVLTTSPT